MHTFARTEWRQRRHYEHSSASAAALAEGGRNRRRGTDPVEEAARREFGGELEKFLNDKKFRTFWDLLAAGMKLPAIVQELGITMRHARRWREKLGKELPKEVKPYWE